MNTKKYALVGFALVIVMAVLMVSVSAQVADDNPCARPDGTVATDGAACVFDSGAATAGCSGGSCITGLQTAIRPATGATRNTGGSGSPPYSTGYGDPYGGGYPGYGYGGGYGGFGGGGGGLLGGVLGSMGSIIGSNDPMTMGIWGFLIGTVSSYYSMGEVPYIAVVKDLVIDNLRLLISVAPSEVLDTDIEIVRLGKTSFIPLEGTLGTGGITEAAGGSDDSDDSTGGTDSIIGDGESLSPGAELGESSISTIDLAFVNTTGLEQESPNEPLFRTFLAEASRYFYETEYNKKVPEELEVDEDATQDFIQKFHLQFNSYKPGECGPDTFPCPAQTILNCQLGSKMGSTGPTAMPRIGLAHTSTGGSFSPIGWDWSSVRIDTCDESREDYIYCDATQFTISLMNKLQEIKEFIEDNQDALTEHCPSPEGSASVETQELMDNSFDVGITKMQVKRVSDTAVNVITTIESNNSKEMQVDLTVVFGDEVRCEETVSLISKKQHECEVTGINTGGYTVSAAADVDLCVGCENNDVSNDSITLQTIVGQTGVEQCEPYNTSRLGKFIESAENAGDDSWSSSKAEQVLSYIKFNTHLIKDGYTTDFQKDFDEYALTKAFFDPPQWYVEADSVGEILRNTDAFEFEYPGSPNAPLSAGKYSAEINIEFNNAEWEFFKDGEPDVTVTVRFVKLASPAPDSPFYYLPFDGQIGLDTVNGRQGYGVNYRQESMETIKINDSSSQPVFTSNIASSTPVFGSWIKSSLNESFVVLNKTRRGILLDVRANPNETDLVFSPSYATPVMMEVERSQGEDAYGFYTVEVGKTPQSNMASMLPWSGIGFNCKDFKDKPVIEAFRNTLDVHGIETQCARLGANDITSYGVEWCNPVENGIVTLESVVFTPQSVISTMERSTYADDMTLIGPGGRASKLTLGGTTVTNQRIDSVEDIFRLMSQEKVCVIGAGNKISSQFFWNPKEILESLSEAREHAESVCITG